MMAVAMAPKRPMKANLSTTMTLGSDASNQGSADAVSLVNSAVTEHAGWFWPGGRIGAMRSHVLLFEILRTQTLMYARLRTIRYSLFGWAAAQGPTLRIV